MNGPASPRRKAVFDPMALDDLDATLAPPEPAPTPTNSRSEGDQATEVDTPEPASTGPAPVNPPSDAGPAGAGASAGIGSVRGTPSRRSRPSASSGARATPTLRQQRSARGRIPTAVRLPADLYRQVNDVLLSGSERPSYGQLVMWTVEDHYTAVSTQVEATLPSPTDRVPRGRKLAQDRTPVTLQLLNSEREYLDDLAAGVAQRYEDARVTRTDVAIAALTVALQVRTGSAL